MGGFINGICADGWENGELSQRIESSGKIRLTLGEGKWYYYKTDKINIASHLICNKADPYIRRNTKVKNKSNVNNHSNLVYHWKSNKSIPARQEYLDKFQEHWVKNESIFDQDYQVICLMQIRNESQYLPDVLLHLDRYFDGIILLDDESDDDSFCLAKSSKLIMKVKRKYKGHFDDLENRNLLLEAGHLFKTQWFIFMDADERIDHRYDDFNSFIFKEDIASVRFNLIHLWNNEKKYRKNLPEGQHGIMKRHRMFRNNGFMQIHSNRDLYFPATPFQHHTHDPMILILHYGLMTKAVREKKFTNYRKQDEDGKKQGYQYNYLHDENVILGSVNEVMLSHQDIFKGQAGNC